MNGLWYTVAGMVTLLTVAPHEEEKLEKRHAFSVPLATITTLFDGDSVFVEAFVTYGSMHEGWAIGPIDNRYVKDSRRERVDHFYRELATRSYLLSPFEAKVMEQVCKSYEETLVLYERYLKSSQWDRLCYLDGYFPSFFKGLFYLYSSSFNSFSALPRVTHIADSLYEPTLTSFKTDQRIAIWRDNPEHTVKLRIAAKELGFQLQDWRKRELAIPDDDARGDKSKKFREAHELFVRLYFNLPPASLLRKKIFKEGKREQ